jgi:hypothetical protein
MSANTQLIEFVKKSPVSVGCAVLSLALIIAAYFRWDYKAEAAALLEQKSTEAARLSANLKNAGQLKEQYDSLLASEKEIESRLIRASQLTTNNQYFYKLESETGVKLLDLRAAGLTAAQKKDPPKGYIPLSFQVSVQGEYAQVLKFLRQLESGAHYCRVLTASCAVGQDRDALLTLTLNLELLGLP